MEDVNTQQTDAWFNTNIRLGWVNERFEAIFFVNNVADDDTMQSAFTTPGLASSFIFNHARSTHVPPDTGGCCVPGGRGGALLPGDPELEVWSVSRGGPEFNSGVAGGSLRPPRHWGVRFAMRFGG